MCVLSRVHETKYFDRSEYSRTGAVNIIFKCTHFQQNVFYLSQKFPYIVTKLQYMLSSRYIFTN
jgi:hypothetical protein